jgi:acetyltransferase-like isoleucine patch superfamily enzyme
MSSYIVGRHTYGKPTIRSWGEDCKVVIGSFCSISSHAWFYLGGNHRVDWISTFPFSEFSGSFPGAKRIKGHPATKGSIYVGNDVWIGDKVSVLSGSIIEDGCVIGANTVVAGKIEPYSVVVGNPARVIRKRFTDKQIEALLEIEWWNWPDRKITKNLPLLMSGDIQGFIKKHRRKK